MLRLRSGPQEMPGGWLIAGSLVLAYLGQGIVADQIVGDPDSLPRSLVAISVQFGIVAVLLNLRNFHSRVPQTLSALAGTGFIFGLLSLMILTRIDPGRPQPNLALLYLILFGWSLAVDAHIYRHALSVKFGIGALMAVLIFAVNFMLLKTLFG
jgi:hypothetical protein